MLMPWGQMRRRGEGEGQRRKRGRGREGEGERKGGRREEKGSAVRRVFY